VSLPTFVFSAVLAMCRYYLLLGDFVYIYSSNKPDRSVGLETSSVMSYEFLAFSYPRSGIE
jgi:hypothetical protein